jgi:Fe-S cluster biogenesis protein NfuA
VIDLTPVRDIVQADGGDIELVTVDGTTAHLRLLLVEAGCAECLLPRPMLEEVALKLLRPTAPDLTRVRIDDPREQPDA